MRTPGSLDASPEPLATPCEAHRAQVLNERGLTGRSPARRAQRHRIWMRDGADKRRKARREIQVPGTARPGRR